MGIYVCPNCNTHYKRDDSNIYQHDFCGHEVCDFCINSHIEICKWIQND